MQDAFPDGLVHVDLRGSGPMRADPAEVLNAILASFGVDVGGLPPGLGLAERERLYRTHLSRRRILVFLDDASHEAQVRPLLCGAPGCAVLVTSRHLLPALESVKTIHLGPLTTAESTDLLANISGTQRIEAEMGACATIARVTGNLPLAIRIAGASLAAHPHWPVRELAARLSDDNRRLGELAIGDLSVEAAFRSSYLALDTLGRRAFRLLGALRKGECSAQVAGPWLAVDATVAEDVLDGVVQANLAEVARYDQRGRSWYRLPALLRDFARTALLDETPISGWVGVSAGRGLSRARRGAGG